MPAINTTELSELDLRYEAYRMKHPKQEERLLLSILEKGIRDPLRGVRIGKTKCLLDGFKRIRCAKRLKITTVPYLSLGCDEAMGIIDLMRDSFARKLNIIEEIKLIDALKTTHGLSIAEIAAHLGKSKAWVSVRVVMNRELTSTVAGQILSGRFPARSYLYSILPFTRVNGIESQEIDRFVKRVAGNNFSTRDIELLTKAYFNGKAEIREQIENGNLQWTLDRLKDDQVSESNTCTSLEQSVLKGLKSTWSGMQLIERHGHDPKLESGSFFAQVNMLTKGILDSMAPFLKATRSLYDRSR